MKLNMTTALNKSGFIISRVQLIALHFNLHERGNNGTYRVGNEVCHNAKN